MNMWSQLLTTKRQTSAQEPKLSDGQMKALKVLRKMPGVAAAELGRKMNISTEYANWLLNELHNNGWATKAKHVRTWEKGAKRVGRKFVWRYTAKEDI
jgi:DNA-binding MarR family transcriptional regulator